MYRAVLFAIILVMLPATFWARGVDDVWRALTPLASGRLDAGDGRHARGIGAAESSEETLAKVFNDRGNAHYDRGLYDPAIVDFDTAIRFDPGFAAAYNNRGRAYAAMGLYDPALADYDTAIGLDPDYIEAHYNRGIARAAKGLHDKAITDFDTAIGLAPDYAEAYNNRGISYAAKGRYERAIADYEAAIELDAKSAHAYYNRGNAHAAKRRYDEAIADFDVALRLKPDYAFAFRNRGDIKFFRGLFAAAALSYDAAIGLDLTDIYAMLRLYVARERAGHDGRAELETRTADIDRDGWPGVVAALYLGEATPERVLAAARDADPRRQREMQCEAFFYIGEYHLLKGEESEAKRSFEKALATGATTFIEYSAAKMEIERLERPL